MLIDGLEDTPPEAAASGCGFAGFPGDSKSDGDGKLQTDGGFLDAFGIFSAFW
jgi:hypothetical protein